MAAFLSGCSSDDQSEPLRKISTPEPYILSQTDTPASAAEPEALPSEGKIIALTFDDGPNTTCTPKVLDVLEKYGIKASFFVIGDNIDEDTAGMMIRAHNMGCEINNHSKTHSYMNKMDEEDIKSELDYTSKLIEEYVGEKPKFFRPPYIAVSSEMYKATDLPFICGKGCNDWEESVSAKERADRVLAQAEDGDIILLHDSEFNDKTVEALDTIIPALRERGFSFVTVSELFAAKGVTPDGGSEILYSNCMQQ